MAKTKIPQNGIRLDRTDRTSDIAAITAGGTPASEFYVVGSGQSFPGGALEAQWGQGITGKPDENGMVPGQWLR
jgi:hypothetical protein